MIRIYTDGISYPNNLPPRQGHNSASSLTPNINLTFWGWSLLLWGWTVSFYMDKLWYTGSIFTKDFCYLLKKILEVDCLGGGESVLLAWWWYLHSLWSVEINNENEGVLHWRCPSCLMLKIYKRWWKWRSMFGISAASLASCVDTGSTIWSKIGNNNSEVWFICLTPVGKQDEYQCWTLIQLWFIKCD